jgi:hypothetical protein
MAVGNTKQESAMMKFSQTPRQSILALVAVAALGSVVATDASARGFGGGFGGGGRSFAGGGLSGGQAFRAQAVARPVGGNGASPSPARLISTGPAAPGKSGGTYVKPGPIASNNTSPPISSGPLHPGTIQPLPGGIRPLPPGAGLRPIPSGGTIQPPPGGFHPLPPNAGLQPPGLHVLPPAPPPQLIPTEPPRPIDPNPPAYPPAGGGDGPTISVGLIGAAIGDAVIEAPAVSYAPVSGPTCDRLLRNGCYLAMRKYSTPNGVDLRCSMICE